MIGDKGPRKRAVRPTTAALVKLKAALHERWRSDQRSRKLTRETQAELLGVSVATAGRILAGRGVDRPTLTLVYKRLGLDWDESCCELVIPELATVEESSPAPAETSAIAATPRRRNWLIPVAVAGIVLCAMLIGASRWRSGSLNPTKTPVGMILLQGFEEFHRGNFKEASELLSKGIAGAREARDAGALSSALRMDGDLAMAQGLFEKAERRYVDARVFTAEVGLDRNLPAVDQALGDVNTKLGDFDEAREYLTRALAAFKSYKDDVGVAMVSRDLGTLAFQQHDLRAAHAWFGASLKAVRGLDKPDIETDITARAALILRDQGRLEEARRILEVCLKYWQAKDHARWIATTELQLGTVEVVAGKLDAHALLTSAKEGFEKVGDRAGAADAANWLEKAKVAANTIPPDPLAIPDQRDAGLRR